MQWKQNNQNNKNNKKQISKLNTPHPKYRHRKLSFLFSIFFWKHYEISIKLSFRAQSITIWSCVMSVEIDTTQLGNKLSDNCVKTQHVASCWSGTLNFLRLLAHANFQMYSTMIQNITFKSFSWWECDHRSRTLLMVEQGFSDYTTSK